MSDVDHSDIFAELHLGNVFYGANGKLASFSIKDNIYNNNFFVNINSSGVAFTKDSGQFFENFSRKFDKLNTFTDIRTGGQIVTAGNGMDPIVEILSSWITVTGLYARFCQMSPTKYAQKLNDKATAKNHQILIERF